MTMTHPAVSTPSTGCRLVSLDGRTLPLERVRLLGEAGAGLAQIVVEQTFRNPHAEALSLTYTLPLPADAAVIDFAFQLGERRISGEVDRKADARERFEDAILEGRSAALLEQERSSVFTQELGNIPPGAQVVAEITVECPLAWRDDGWELRFPTVVAPRFLGAPGRTPDADRVSVDVADGEVPVDVQVEIRIDDTLTRAPTSPSHVIAVDAGRVTLPIDARLDRDIVVRWPVAAAEPGVSLDVARPDGDESSYGLLTLLPPEASAGTEPVPRDLVVLLDTSGSMGGRPLEQAKAFLRGLIGGLGSRDRLELMAFSSRQERWSKVPRAMDPTARAQALRFVETLQAGGGTHMHEAIIEALQPLRPDAQRQVVLITDGLIGFESQVIAAIRTRLPATSRVHTIGVGSAVNRSLLRPGARAGGGTETIVGLDEAVEDAVTRLLARTAEPQVVDLHIEGDVVLDVAPARLPDLFGAAPSRLHLRLRSAGGTLRVRGRTARGDWVREIAIAPVDGGGRRSVITRYARERVEDLEIAHAAGETAVDAEIEALGLRHRIATRLTSWVAISDQADVDPTAPFRRETLPQQLPYGMSAEGVGLRPAGMRVARMLQEPRSLPMAASMPSAKRSRRSARAQIPSWLFGTGSKEHGRPPIAPSPPPFEAEEAAYDDEGVAAPEPMPVRTLELVARVVRQRRRKLVIEVEVPEDIDWEPGEVLVHLADGRTVSATLERPPRTGPVRAGATLRLFVRIPKDASDPVRVTLTSAGLRLELTLERR